MQKCRNAVLMTDIFCTSAFEKSGNENAANDDGWWNYLKKDKKQSLSYQDNQKHSFVFVRVGAETDDDVFVIVASTTTSELPRYSFVSLL